MNCKVSVSFGEVIDKLTILKIKISNTNDESVLKNLNCELDSIIGDHPISNSSDPLFQELFIINQKLYQI